MNLELHDVVRSLGGREVLRGVTFTCAAGEIVGLTGPNGAGKSTLLRILAGVLEPDSGRLVVDGRNVPPGDLALRRSLGYVADGAEPSPHLTPRELLELVCVLKEVRDPPAPQLDRLGLTASADVRYGLLSVGQKRRALLACALVGEPSLLVLDEPTAGLDPDGLVLLATLLREHRARGGSALVASHEYPFLDDLGARRIHLDSGRIVT